MFLTVNLRPWDFVASYSCLYDRRQTYSGKLPGVAPGPGIAPGVFLASVFVSADVCFTWHD